VAEEVACRDENANGQAGRDYAQVAEAVQNLIAETREQR